MTTGASVSTVPFWERRSTIREFAALAPPDYWRVFFEERTDAVDRVLDLGCGGGRNTELLLDLGYEVAACDLSRGMVASTARRVRRHRRAAAARVALADMRALPYRDAGFDATIANGVLHNLETAQMLDGVIDELARVLRTGGYLCLNMFTDVIVDSALTPRRDAHSYRTPAGLAMLLLSPSSICGRLGQVGFEPLAPVVEYRRDLPVGPRAVLRGEFILQAAGPSR